MSGVVLFALGLLASSGAASPEPAAPGRRAPDLTKIGVDQRVGASVPLDLAFRDERGHAAVLRERFAARRPVLLAPVYFGCRTLCNQSLMGLASSLKAVSLRPGVDFDVVAVSFDPREGAALAAERREITLHRYGGGGEGFHFLTGDAEPVAALMEAVGFRYVFDESTGEYAHAAALVILTPDGKISRYLLGTEYAPREVRLGLVEAADGRIGTVVDQALLYCFEYDPTTGAYGFVAMRLVRAGGVLLLLGLGVFVYSTERRRRLVRPARAAGGRGAP